MVLGSRNPVAGPYHNFSMPEPGGVCVAMHGACERHPLLGFLSLVLPPLCAGNAVVAIAHPSHPLGALLVAESAPTADVPPGALNVLTGQSAELATWIAGHRDVDSVHAAADSETAAILRGGAAENLKRVHVLPENEEFSDEDRWRSPRRLTPFIETKTIWHPSAC
jgi:acyl-CoA reductase-like NAD-dependent aldehyde dehydrogenase